MDLKLMLRWDKIEGMNQLKVYEGGTAIVTGGASGIGRGLALELGRRGCFVVVADILFEQATETARQILSAGGAAQALRLDVTDYASVEETVRATVEKTGRLDFMFNNAGIAIGGDTHLHVIRDWNLVIDVNLRGVVHGVQSAYAVMRRQGFGHIVNTASMAALMPCPLLVGYALTKYAVLGLSKSLRPEAASSGVRVSVICPGVVRTSILEHCIAQSRIISNDVGAAERLQFFWRHIKPMDPDTFAAHVLDKAAKNKFMIIAPWYWRLIKNLHAFFPGLGLWLSQKIYEKVKGDLVQPR